DDLFGMMDALRARGRSIILISHKLAEVLRAADRITVLRRGRRVATLPRAEATANALAALMIGDRPETGGAGEAGPGGRWTAGAREAGSGEETPEPHRPRSDDRPRTMDGGVKPDPHGPSSIVHRPSSPQRSTTQSPGHPTPLLELRDVTVRSD